ncbi:MAG: flagellar hook-basal body complex protein FliE [Candidatus Solibacter sp.]|jgi:flagellar hook-basal body complex protein FliE
MTLPISNITPIGMPQMTPAAGAVGQPGEFQNVLSGAINSLESLQDNAADSVKKFLTGQNEELHTTILATQKAELAFELGLQVRNKVVDAYQEVMKMQM